VAVKLVRTTPELVRTANDQRDFFCIGSDDLIDELRQRGWTIVPLHDGWYANDTGGGVAVWGDGRFCELRDTPFSVRDSLL
jgi:hypothetical protein